MNNFIKIGDICKLGRVIDIIDKDVNGEIMLTRDGTFKKVKVRFVSVGSIKKYGVSLLIIDFKVDGLKAKDIVEFVEIEPSLNMEPKTKGVNAGKPRYAIEPKNLDAIFIAKKVDTGVRYAPKDSLVFDAETMMAHTGEE